MYICHQIIFVRIILLCLLYSRGRSFFYRRRLSIIIFFFVSLLFWANIFLAIESRSSSVSFFRLFGRGIFFLSLFIRIVYEVETCFGYNFFFLFENVIYLDCFAKSQCLFLPYNHMIKFVHRNSGVYFAHLQKTE